MTDNSRIKVRTIEDLTKEEFESRTSLPANATLNELEALGGRYFASKPVKINGKETRIEYVFLDPSAAEREVYVWKRIDSEGDLFRIHLEINTVRKY